MHLTLLIPELLWSNPDDRSVYEVLDASALAALLGRATVAAEARQSGDEWLARAAGFADAPLAALRAAGDDLDPGDTSWICADPVHLRFHQERLILADASQLAIAPEESAALLQTLNATFPDIGRFVAATPERWSLQLAQPVARAWPPLSQVVGRELTLDPLLADPLLKRLGHEVQMLLHAHPVNRARDDAGRLTINALWFWGAGALPATRPELAFRLLGDSPLARGLGRVAGAPAAARPASLAELLASSPGQPALVELDELLAPASFENAHDYLDVWKRLDRDWFAGLAGALRSGRLAGVDLVAPTAFGLLRWSLARASAWKFWGRRRPLSAQVAALIERKDR